MTGLPLLFLMGALLPPVLDDWKKVSSPSVPPLEHPSVAKEFGLLESESAQYQRAGKSFTLVIHRLKDNTGAVAFEQSLRKPQSTRRLFRHQNFVLESAEGNAPRGALDAFLLPTLPKADRSAAPNLTRYLPRQGLIAGSERYILGPESLKVFAPRIPVGAAGFDFAGELQSAHYVSPEGGAWLGIFQYPNQIIARQQAEVLEQSLTGIRSAALKREGPLVAVVLPIADGTELRPETAQALTNPIVYRAELVMDKKPPKEEPHPAEFLIGVFKLCGILMLFCLGTGLAFAGALHYLRRNSSGGEDDAMTSLRI